MSVQTVETQNPAPQTVLRPVRPQLSDDGGLTEFNYRPVPVTAVVGFVLAIFSATAVLIWMALPVCALALLVSTLSLVGILRSRGASGGLGLSLAGMILSIAFLCTGVWYQIHLYESEVPEGYERVNFANDISAKQVTEVDGVVGIPPEVAALVGKKISLRGYIYQSNETQNLMSFLLVKDNQSCCFGANPAIWDRMGVVMQDGKTINYCAGKVTVSGTFRINPHYHGQGELEPIYIVQGDYFSNWVSDF